MYEYLLRLQSSSFLTKWSKFFSNNVMYFSITTTYSLPKVNWNRCILLPIRTQEMFISKELGICLIALNNAQRDSAICFVDNDLGFWVAVCVDQRKVVDVYCLVVEHWKKELRIHEEFLDHLGRFVQFCYDRRRWVFFFLLFAII